MTDRLRSPSLLALVPSLANRLFEEWRKEGVNITDAVDTVRALDGAVWPPLAGMSDLSRALREGLIEKASGGCGSDELRELISIVDLSNQVVADALRQGFEEYTRSYFEEELRECRSSEQFNALVQNLELFKSELQVATTREVNQTEGSKAEFQQQEDDRADYMQDEWHDRRRGERASEGNIRDMFNSLRNDRN